MRHELQPWNHIRIRLEIVDLGVGQTGETVTATLRRTSDGQYLQSGGGWGASPSNLTLTEPSSANQPGLYSYTVTAADLDPSDGHYVAKISNSTFNILEYVAIIPTLPAEDARKHFNLRNRIKFKPTAWDSTSKQPTAGQLYTYATDALFAADTVPDGTGAEESWDMTGTFSSGQLTLFTTKPT